MKRSPLILCSALLLAAGVASAQQADTVTAKDTMQKTATASEHAAHDKADKSMKLSSDKLNDKKAKADDADAKKSREAAKATSETTKTMNDSGDDGLK